MIQTKIKTPVKKKSSSQKQIQTAVSMTEHFAELRRRFILCVLFWVVASIASYILAPHVINLLIYPFARAIQQSGTEHHFIYTGIAESFIMVMKTSILAGFVLTVPMIGYQIFAFVRPALFAHEKKAFIVFLLAAPALFLTGLLFAYFIVLPMAYAFFLDFQMMDTLVPIQLEAKVSEYLTLTYKMLIAFGAAFELPLLLLVLGRAGIITDKSLKKFRRYAIVLIFIVAAILTPPDVISQIALAVPLLVLYEIGIFLLKEKSHGQESS